MTTRANATIRTHVNKISTLVLGNVKKAIINKYQAMRDQYGDYQPEFKHRFDAITWKS
jgi:hypothetical protein